MERLVNRNTVKYWKQSSLSGEIRVIYILDGHFSNFNVQRNYLEILLKADSNSIGLRRGLRFQISNKLPGHDPAGLLVTVYSMGLL